VRSNETLRVWITDPVGWWGAQASEPLCHSGHHVKVFSSVEDLRASSANDVTPDVIVYSCTATTKDDLEALARLAAGPWMVVVVVAEIDVRTSCSIFECGVAAIGGRYDPPSMLIGTIENANRSERMRRNRKAAWSVPV